jgi:selenocysteine lyase/cysteine desulfurase
VNNPPPAHRGLADGPVYLDYNATTPVDPRVTDAMAPYLATFFGNPSSDHAFGTPPSRALLQARQQVAGLINAAVDEIVFTPQDPRQISSHCAARLWPLPGPGRTSSPRPPSIPRSCRPASRSNACTAPK